jgi:hypothetical protein
MDYRPGTSNGRGKRQIPFPCRSGGEQQTLPNICKLQIGVFGCNLPIRLATGEQSQHRCDWDSQVANARDPAHLLWINSDAVEIPHGYL